ncbi:PREDICTED: galactoside 2-alpha-L-fucosyltransferase 2-like [Crocodylus porosus]|uniref:galactoside 2-alpha-L-fucosyltransferase 2-like n=1 Tax=Crocodylus porosus TaxID=8502 RepID=UPI00093DBEA0|nr:PREDICTED: galactoside 2-alpha-L-fucosyltransferase 2-like [Crocodylus porosus]
MYPDVDHNIHQSFHLLIPTPIYILPLPSHNSLATSLYPTSTIFPSIPPEEKSTKTIIVPLPSATAIMANGCGLPWMRVLEEYPEILAMFLSLMQLFSLSSQAGATSTLTAVAVMVSWIPSTLVFLLILLLLAFLSVFLFLFLDDWQSDPRHRLPYPKPIRHCQDTSSVQGIWTVNSIGRLGNQMGEYATLYALAKMNGHQACILPEMHQHLGSLFHITLPVLHKDMVKRIPWRNYQLHDWMSEEYRHIQGKYVQLTGYPCSWTFYHHLRDEILWQFSFRNHVRDEANQYLARLRGQRRNVTYVGIHVRRGDYVQLMRTTWKGVVADRAYLEKAMGYFRAKYEEPVFVVTSNGMDWCRKNIDASRGDVYFAGDGKELFPGRDFALLAHCNHTIMTIGTFGIWAAYLAKGETIYLANYTLPDSPFLQIFKPSAAFLPEWIGISADLSPLLSLETDPPKPGQQDTDPKQSIN